MTVAPTGLRHGPARRDLAFPAAIGALVAIGIGATPSVVVHADDNLLTRVVTRVESGSGIIRASGTTSRLDLAVAGSGDRDRHARRVDPRQRRDHLRGQPAGDDARQRHGAVVRTG